MGKFEEVFDLFERSFGFLESELGLRLERALRRRRPAYLTRIELIYSNRTTGVVVSWEPRDLYVFRDAVPSGRWTVPQRCSQPRAGHGAQLLRLERSGTGASAERRRTCPGWGLDWPTPPGGLKGIIAGQARNFQPYSRPIMDGDFSVFPDLDRIVKASARDADIRELGAERAREIWGNLD